MTEANLLNLRSGSLDLWLAPGVGGSISRLDHIQASGQRTPVLRGCEGTPATVLEAASFPLVPYCNRIRKGRFTFRGRQISISRNMASDPSPLHGDGWLSPWEVLRHDEREAELRFHHTAGEWPWAYEARQHFKLDDHGLSVSLSCRNLADEPMPCGLGQHPYFPCAAETRLDTQVSHVWTIDEQVLPVERQPALGRYDLTNRVICGQGLDHGFGNWSRRAEIVTAGSPFKIRLASPDADYFQVYSPTEGRLFVAEPVTHANAALNEPEEQWASLGMRILGPGEHMLLTMSLEIGEGP